MKKAVCSLSSIAAPLRRKRSQGFAASLSGHFATGEQSPDADAHLGIRYRWSATGIPVLEDSLAQFTCNVVAEYLAGDHTIFLGEVETAAVRRWPAASLFPRPIPHFAALT